MCASAGRSALVAILLLVSSTAFGQIDLKPTPAPTITAESASWYQSKEPITFAGNTYYPAGAQEFFNGNEMVRSGYYRGVPIYTRTTEEPFSKVYVPLAEKSMQPYERRREGELAGTVGGSAPSFPVGRSTDPEPDATAGGPPQAAGPPTGVAPEPIPAVVSSPPSPRSTSSGASANPSPKRTKVVTAKKPAGLNAVFVEYGGRKWFSNGGTVEYSASRFKAIGKYHDLPVYADRKDKGGTIYIPVENSPDALLAPYTSRKR
jgi:hypothetical protein